MHKLIIRIHSVTIAFYLYHAWIIEITHTKQILSCKTFLIQCERLSSSIEGKTRCNMYHHYIISTTVEIIVDCNAHELMPNLEIFLYFMIFPLSFISKTTASNLWESCVALHELSSRRQRVGQINIVACWLGLTFADDLYFIWLRDSLYDLS